MMFIIQSNKDERIDFWKPLYLNNLPIATVTSYKYLGVNITAGKRFETPTRKPLMSFYCSANSVGSCWRRQHDPQCTEQTK